MAPVAVGFEVAANAGGKWSVAAGATNASFTISWSNRNLNLPNGTYLMNVIVVGR